MSDTPSSVQEAFESAVSCHCSLQQAGQRREETRQALGEARKHLSLALALHDVDVYNIRDCANLLQSAEDANTAASCRYRQAHAAAEVAAWEELLARRAATADYEAEQAEARQVAAAVFKAEQVEADKKYARTLHVQLNGD